MKAKSKEQHPVKFNLFRWLAVFAMVSGGVVANSLYAAQPLSLRLIAWLFLGLVVLFLASTTAEGIKVLAYAQSSRAELQKVTWPTRQETIQTTFIVAVMVVLLSVIIWGLDAVLLWAVGLLTGQRG